MKTVGLVVEYNPFHNGHLYHLTESKRVTNADAVIAVMSGSFLQRGEPALVDKWARTKMALLGGCDIVIELPYLYAVQHASLFARGAVAALDQLKVDTVAFGSEDGSIDRFQETIRFMEQNKASYEKYLHLYLQKGFSYPRASSAAYSEIKPPAFNGVDLSAPNNILGIQYCEAVKDLESSITPYTITREKAGYHDPEPGDSAIASATSIRNRLLSEEYSLDDVRPFVPETTFDVLKEFYKTHGQWHQWNDYFPYIQHQLITKSPKELGLIYEMEEGLEYRFKKAVTKAGDFESFMDYVKTKRYTRTRLQRSLVHLLLGTTKKQAGELVHPLRPEYIRVLGMSENGRNYLNGIKKEIDVPLISNASKGDSIPALEKDIQAATVHYLPLVLRGTGSPVREYTAHPIRVNKNEEASI
ncbi:nucleotidyltransferase [Bacillus sp. H-16]|uniref:nucleotidyltransferase n=1 Tax=Alteribacter salitolerans TaxID=2912333 RepID=UPI001966B577|nr:nucleotidyltransferase [Alteribacter salitolerans]MBM7095883.1 nucleotidyltransferase [Alteribacter salitolerans]